MIQGRILGREGNFIGTSGDLSGPKDAANGALAHRRKWAPAVAAPAVTTKLSDREIQIMLCLRNGKSNQEIGSSLAISAYTVKNHLQRIFRKLAVFNRTHAVSKYFMAEQAPEG